jgi:hypothetical protein
MTTHEISPIFFSVAFLASGQAHQFSTCLARSRMLQKKYFTATTYPALEWPRKDLQRLAPYLEPNSDQFLGGY